MTQVTESVRAGKFPFTQIAKRSAVVAVLIGTTLTLANQYNALFGNAEANKLQMAMVFITPFLVVSASKYFGIREARKRLSQGTSGDTGFVAALFSHGILYRAVALGLAAGTANAGLASIAILEAGQSLDQLPASVIAQALILPILFGALSQTLSFRRAIKLSA